MVGIAHADRCDAMRLGATDRLLRGPCGDHLAHAVMSVDQGEAPGIDDEFGLREGIANASLQARRVP